MQDSAKAIWEKAVDVQMHFNDVITNNRRISAFVVLGLYAASTSANFSDDIRVRIWGFDFVTPGLALAGLVFTIFAALADRFYYYQLLIQSVKFAEALESDFPAPLRLTASLSGRVPESRAWKLSGSFYGGLFVIGLFALFV